MTHPVAADLVLIRWYDAVNESTRTDESELAKVKLAENTNLGWIVHENDERIVLAHGFSSTGEVDHFTIATGDIIERIFLARGNRET